MHIVYVLESLSDHGWYIGYTTDLKKRLDAHNHHRNVSTAHRGPWKLLYAEAYIEKLDALGREKFLKSGNGREILKKQMRHYLSDTSTDAQVA
ncbi:MAG: GIY-YIG nuclease family protein [Candidatus Peregrinibacteria bacterium]